MNGAQLLIKLLQQQGIKQLFGYPGGAIMPVYDALLDSGIEHLMCRHEQGAGFAALGYARSKQSVGVCLATSGPGATNLITALADAQFDSVPMIAICGQVPMSSIGTDAFQEIDVLGLSLSVTKHSFLVTDANDLNRIVPEAFELAASGKPGPVLIDIPKDVQCQNVSYQPYLKSAPVVKPIEHQSIKQIIELVEQASRPLFYLGGGIAIAQATNFLRELMDATLIPCVSTLKALGIVPCDHSLNLGMLGMHGNPAANNAVQSCDLLIAVGARFDDRVTGKLDSFAPHAKVIHFDIDEAEIGKRRAVDVAILGDLSIHLKQLTTLLISKQIKLDLIEWHSQVKLLKEHHSFIKQTQNNLADIQQNIPSREQKQDIFAPDLLRQLSSKLSSTLDKKHIIATDVGQHQMWVAQHMQFSEPFQLLTSGGLGTMGFGLPAAIGAQLAQPDRAVVLVTGDGSIMMNIQELATIKRAKLPLKILLFDNQRLGMVRQWQQLFFEERYSQVQLEDNPDFVALAAAFGIKGERIVDQEQVPDALERLLNSTDAYLLHVIIDQGENVWPLVPPNQSIDQMMESLS